MVSFQDQVLQKLAELETDFYLTGGTAASRGYLNHRFSDDLDLFVNDDSRFGLWSERIVHTLSQSGSWHTTILQREERFVRLILTQTEASLKIELVNDVPAHTGQIQKHPVLGRLDSAENILANKLTALVGREEPKDLADVWGFCCHEGLL
jgi:predicted nucleotidyltransferase component of viral defense system